MKRIKIDIDGWFRDFRGTVRSEGHLPDFGATSMAMADAPSDVDPKSFDDPAILSRFNGDVFSGEGWFYLSEIAFCFWRDVTCWKCGQPSNVHSPIAKLVHLHCDLEVRPEIAEDGKQVVLFSSPIAQLRTSGLALSFMPYAIAHVDKMVACTWTQIAGSQAMQDRLGGVVADVSYRESNEYGARYWAMTCPHCQAIMGEHYLKPHPEHSAQDLQKVALHRPPDLVVVPMMNQMPLLGGFFYARGFMVPIG